MVMTPLTPPEVKITIDQEALRGQISDTINSALGVAAMRLRTAADDLDPEFMANVNRFQDDQEDRAYRKGYADAKAGKESAVKD